MSQNILVAVGKMCQLVVLRSNKSQNIFKNNLVHQNCFVVLSSPLPLNFVLSFNEENQYKLDKFCFLFNKNKWVKENLSYFINDYFNCLQQSWIFFSTMKLQTQLQVKFLMISKNSLQWQCIFNKNLEISYCIMEKNY